MKKTSDQLDEASHNADDPEDDIELSPKQLEGVASVERDKHLVSIMMQRAKAQSDKANEPLHREIMRRLTVIQDRIEYENDEDEIDKLMEDGEQQSRLRAYLCPASEVFDEAQSELALLGEWGVPAVAIEALRSRLPRGSIDEVNLAEARGILRMIYDEVEAWREFSYLYEAEMQKFALFLSCTAVAALVVAFALEVAPTVDSLGHWWASAKLFATILFAGAAGSVVSVLTKMPSLEMGLSKDLDGYLRRILARVSFGILGSIVGCGFLAWGILPISIKGISFADAVNSCSATLPAACGVVQSLLIVTFPVLFGFSERALSEFEQRIFQPAPTSR